MIYSTTDKDGTNCPTVNSGNIQEKRREGKLLPDRGRIGLNATTFSRVRQLVARWFKCGSEVLLNTAA